MTCAAPGRPPGTRRAPLAADAPFLARSATAVLRPRVLVPVWAWTLLAGDILRWAGGLAGGIVLASSGLLLWGLTAFHVRWEVRTGRAPSAGEIVRSVVHAVPDMLLAPLGTLSVPVLFFVLAALGSLVGLIPVVGIALAVLWLATGGLVLILLGAYWLFFAVTAVPLQIAAAAAGSGRTRMEILAESLGKVRRAPLRVILGWIIVLVCASGAAALTAGGIIGVTHLIVGPGVRPGAPEVWVPWLAPSGDTPPGLLAAARLAPAVLVATFFAGSARLDMLLEE